MNDNLWQFIGRDLKILHERGGRVGDEFFAEFLILPTVFDDLRFEVVPGQEQ